MEAFLFICDPWPEATLTYTQTLAVDLVRPARVVSEGFDAAFQVDEEGLQKRLPRVQSLQSLSFMETANIITRTFFTQINLVVLFSDLLHVLVDKLNKFTLIHLFNDSAESSSQEKNTFDVNLLIKLCLYTSSLFLYSMKKGNCFTEFKILHLIFIETYLQNKIEN